jgi:DnaJ-class molecular chaperone
MPQTIQEYVASKTPKLHAHVTVHLPYPCPECQGEGSLFEWDEDRECTVPVQCGRCKGNKTLERATQLLLDEEDTKEFEVWFLAHNESRRAEKRKARIQELRLELAILEADEAVDEE